jgi:GNAT superfamily N-acetyltransferase
VVATGSRRMKTPKHPLENAVWWSLQAEHRHLGEIHGRAGRYRPEVSPFAAVESFDEDSWNDLRVLVGVSRVCVLFGADIPTTLPSGWLSRARGTGYQLVLDPLDLEAGNPVEIRSLMTDDVPQMLELVSVTRPGPFLPETIAMGSYFGHFRGGHLVAMAGERFRFDGFGEVSAVCTHPDMRGQGLASALTNEWRVGSWRRAGNGSCMWPSRMRRPAGSMNLLGFVSIVWWSFCSPRRHRREVVDPARVRSTVRGPSVLVRSLSCPTPAASPNRV